MWLKIGLKRGKNGILKTRSHTSYTQVFKVSKQHRIEMSSFSLKYEFRKLTELLSDSKNCGEVLKKGY